jgi:RNA polymerase sigma-70 factor (ECF subfamily)
MLHDADEAAEATQEVFLAAFKNIRRFRRDAKFSTWIYRISVNHCISRIRRRPSVPHYSIEADGPSSSLAEKLPAGQSHEAAVLAREKGSHVKTALGFLSPEQKAVVELKFYQDLTFEEIADVVNAPLSTVKSRLYSGLEILKGRLAGIL